MRRRGLRLAVVFAAIGLAVGMTLLALGLGAHFRWSAYLAHFLALMLGLFGTAAALGGWAGVWTFRGKGLVPCLVVSELALLAGVTAGALPSFLLMPPHEAFLDAVSALLVRPVEAVLVSGTAPALVLGTIYFIALKAGSRASPSPEGDAARR